MSKKLAEKLKNKPPCFLCGGRKGTLKPYQATGKIIKAHPDCRSRISDNLLDYFVTLEIQRKPL
jgi:hypothetical protein